jgi:hypothetical protein
VDHKSGTTPADDQAQDDSRSADNGSSIDRSDIGHPGFGERGRMRRRVRFLRKARELAYRDLGGLVFNLHRFAQRNDALVMAKLDTLGHIDAELRTLDAALQERRPVTVLREAGITACARCAAIHSSGDHYCPNCGLSLEPHADLPIAGAASVPAAPPTTSSHAPAPSSPQPSARQAGDVRPTTEAPLPTSTPAPAPPGSTATPAPARMPDPVTGVHPRRTVPAGGRSPSPPAASNPPAAKPAEGASGEDEPTEILHPPSTGP